MLIIYVLEKWALWFWPYCKNKTWHSRFCSLTQLGWILPFLVKTTYLIQPLSRQMTKPFKALLQKRMWYPSIPESLYRPVCIYGNVAGNIALDYFVYLLQKKIIFIF
jgi:hypothetical protein